VSGHLTWAAVAAFPHPPAVLTVLRDPVEWTLSFYSFLRERHMSGVLASDSQTLANEAATRSLDDLLLDPTSEMFAVIGAYQVIYLSSDEPIWSLQQVPRDQYGNLDCTSIERGFAIAARNLETCTWIGTTETLDRDLQSLAFQLGWESFGIPKRYMVTDGRLDGSSLSTRARRVLDGLVEADRELHARARALADERHHQIVEHLLAERVGART
jgi:hypothetical protein